jgi:hypothetical protein
MLSSEHAFVTWIDNIEYSFMCVPVDMPMETNMCVCVCVCVHACDVCTGGIIFDMLIACGCVFVLVLGWVHVCLCVCLVCVCVCSCYLTLPVDVLCA